MQARPAVKSARLPRLRRPGFSYFGVHCMNHATQYKLNEARFNDRVAEFRAAPTRLSTLRDELALAKALLEDRLNAAGTPAERNASLPVVRDLLGVVANLSKQCRAAELEAGELLGKDALRRFITAATKTIADELSGRFDGWEDSVELIASRLVAALEQTVKEAPRGE